MLKKGGEAFLAYVKEVKPEEMKIEDIWAIGDFSNVFFDGLPRLPPEREIEFTITLRQVQSLDVF